MIRLYGMIGNGKASRFMHGFLLGRLDNDVCNEIENTEKWTLLSSVKM